MSSAESFSEAELRQGSIALVADGFRSGDLAALNDNLASPGSTEQFWLESPSDIEVSSAFFGWQGRVKRAFDIVGAAAALVLLAPFLILVAAAILFESRGPIIFVQRREGRDNEPFCALKFRTMSAELCDPSGVRQTIEGDPRVTPLGSFLRRTSIDELPQLLNVLRGEMSLVGPRPHVSDMLAGGISYRELVPYYDRRLLVRPGLTGLAQARGLRGPTVDSSLARRRIDCDLFYVQNFSLWLDIKIIAMTFRQEFGGGSGA
ncbi:sugar transferase [Devosia sp. RR2S18]|uniref:sugar transferase n=1 Tax=Devosia rhizosphaerae TaxID=3049774 RepID=UPI0025412EAC|nr:sugar transferase [Devosia sp. RR2S18]WIJ23921.1 sugar transferase [Devosia sp. RR2S18]